jgi:hypothetical protein
VLLLFRKNRHVAREIGSIGAFILHTSVQSAALA